VAFAWRARFPFAMRVDDRYANGEGALEVRVLGLRLARHRGSEIAEAEALRYLGELFWVPQAMVANRALEWHEVGERSVEVATRIAARSPSVRFELDEAGDVVAMTCAARPRAFGKTTVRMPWAGAVRDYDVVGGLRVPTRAEARWEPRDGSFPYWRATVTSVELVE
jgi:hypothetical protein